MPTFQHAMLQAEVSRPKCSTCPAADAAALPTCTLAFTRFSTTLSSSPRPISSKPCRHASPQHTVFATECSSLLRTKRMTYRLTSNTWPYEPSPSERFTVICSGECCLPFATRRAWITVAPALLPGLAVARRGRGAARRRVDGPGRHFRRLSSMYSSSAEHGGNADLEYCCPAACAGL
jgi:hypothetical protein